MTMSFKIFHKPDMKLPPYKIFWWLCSWCTVDDYSHLLYIANIPGHSPWEIMYTNIHKLLL